MSDDIYEHLLYDGMRFVTGAQLEPALQERTLTVNGVSKAYAMTGWRLGYGAGPKDLIAAMAVVQSQSTSNPCSISQAAAVEALTGPQDTVAQWREAFQRRRDFVVERLNAHRRHRLPPAGRRLLHVRELRRTDRRRMAPDGKQIDTDTAFCRYLLDAYDVAVVPGSCFGLAPYFRISYAASDADLKRSLRAPRGRLQGAAMTIRRGRRGAGILARERCLDLREVVRRFGQLQRRVELAGDLREREDTADLDAAVRVLLDHQGMMPAAALQAGHHVAHAGALHGVKIESVEAVRRRHHVAPPGCPSAARPVRAPA